MELVYRGKTKDVYRLQDGTIKLKFKDDVTGEDGTFDPGANKVGLTIEGAGESGLLVTTHFFKRLQEEGIPTHYIKTDMNDVSMYVQDRKSTRLNSSHVAISYAVFCLKKKKKENYGHC